MSDQQKYEERVQALAEKMGLVKYADTLKIYLHISENEYLKRKKEAIELMLPAARIAVAEMAEVVKRVLSPNHSKEYIHNWLVTEGLITDTGQEVDQISLHHSREAEKRAIPVNDKSTREIITGNKSTDQEGGQHG